MKKLYRMTLLVGLVIIGLTSCSTIPSALGGAPTGPVATVQMTPSQPVLRAAQVESIEIQLTQTDPAQVNAIVRGNLSESCATLVQPQTILEGNTFEIKVMSSSPADIGCAQVITPYQQTVPLSTGGLAPGTYTVVANGVSTSFSLPDKAAQPTAQPPDAATNNLHLVVEAYDRSVRTVDASVPLNSTVRPFFNSFLPRGGSSNGIGYVIDPNNPDALAVGSNGPQIVQFIQNPAIYGLAVWPGNASSQPRLAWGTASSGLSQSSTIMISALDGTQSDTLLSQDSPNPATELVPEFWSADGQTLYFSKEPLGIGGYILFAGGSSLYKVDITTKEVSEVIPLGPSDGPQACIDAISADYRYVADHCALKAITVRDLQNNISAAIQPPDEISGYTFLGDARFSRNGNHLAYALAMTDQGSEQGWIALSQLNGGSKVILTSPIGILYNLAGWLDDQTLMVQSINVKECLPDCATELWALKIDGSAPTELAQGRFLSLITGDVQPVPPPEGAPAGPSTCQDAAEYISDDGKDGTTYPPNTAFTKTWTVKNIGTCTWDSSYLVYQISGAYMTQQPGYWLVQPGQTVEPGHSVDICVGMTSPVENGTYRSDWVLKDAQGQVIRLKGGTDENSFYVEINVDDGTAHANVTATAIDIVQEQGSGEICSADATYFVHAYISTDGPGYVSYEIGSTAGQISAGYFEVNGDKAPYVEGLLHFAKADNQKIDFRFVGPFPYPDDISVNLRVNGEDWVTTKLNCP